MFLVWSMSELSMPLFLRKINLCWLKLNFSFPQYFTDNTDNNAPIEKLLSCLEIHFFLVPNFINLLYALSNQKPIPVDTQAPPVCIWKLIFSDDRIFLTSHDRKSTINLVSFYNTITVVFTFNGDILVFKPQTLLLYTFFLFWINTPLEIRRYPPDLGKCYITTPIFQ